MQFKSQPSNHVLLGIFLFLLIHPVAFAQTSSEGLAQLSSEDSAEVRHVVSRFFDCYRTKDIEAIKSLWSEESQFFSGHLAEIVRIFENSREISAAVTHFGRIRRDGDEVTVRLEVEFSGSVTVAGKPTELYKSPNRYLILKKVDSVWKIYRHISAERELALLLIVENDPEARERMLVDEPTLVNQQLAEELTEEGNRRRGQGDLQLVLGIYQLGLNIAERIQDRREISYALNSIGNTLSRLGEKAKARETFERSIKISEEIGDLENVARVTYNLADVVENSDEVLERALQLAREVGNKSMIANALGKTGNRYTMRGEFLLAKEVLEEALVLRRELGNPGDVSVGLSNMGILQRFLGNFEESIHLFEESVRVSEEAGEDGGAMIDLYNLGNVQLEMGDFASAMNSYQRSLVAGRKADPNDENAPVLINIADLYKAQGNLEQAETLYRLSLEAFEKSKSNYGISRALSGLSEVYYGRKDYKRAMEFGLKANEIYLAEKDAYAIDSLQHLAAIYADVGDFENARISLDKALKLSEASGSNAEVYKYQFAIANLAFLKGDYNGSLAALKIAEQTYVDFDQRADAWKYYDLLGRVNWSLGRNEEATTGFLRSIELIEKQRSNVAGGESDNQKFFSDKLAPYKSMVQLLVKSGNAEAALGFSERIKARTLLDSITRTHAPGKGRLSESEASTQKLLRNELVEIDSQIALEAEKPLGEQVRMAQLVKKLDQKRLQIEDFRVRLDAVHPELRIARGELEPITVNAVAEVLGDQNSAVLEFTVVQDKAFLFVITKGISKGESLKAFSIPLDGIDVWKKIESLRLKIASGGLDFQGQARELYDLLLKPAAAQLAGKTNLIIVPDGPLWNLPFQALLDSKGKYLIEKAAVSYAPSLTALREMSKKAARRKPGTDAELIAFGNPIVNKETSERIKRVFMSEELDALPEAERLVMELGKMYGPSRSRIYVGNEARESTAKNEAPKYRIVQFATHGILNNVSPMYSHLVMAQNTKNPDEDGLLEAWEMKDLDLKADMVILSACDTARGKISGGEGVIGMSWAMFIAGAPTTVASQWKVESSSTTELMLEFHRQLLSGKNVSKAEALRRASLKVMKMPGFSHPSDWAAFVIVGDGR